MSCNVAINQLRTNRAGPPDEVIVGEPAAARTSSPRGRPRSARHGAKRERRQIWCSGHILGLPPGVIAGPDRSHRSVHPALRTAVAAGSCASYATGCHYPRERTRGTRTCRRERERPGRCGSSVCQQELIAARARTGSRFRRELLEHEICEERMKKTVLIFGAVISLVVRGASRRHRDRAGWLVAIRRHREWRRKGQFGRRQQRRGVVGGSAGARLFRLSAALRRQHRDRRCTRRSVT